MAVVRVAYLPVVFFLAKLFDLPRFADLDWIEQRELLFEQLQTWITASKDLGRDQRVVMVLIKHLLVESRADGVPLLLLGRRRRFGQQRPIDILDKPRCEVRLLVHHRVNRFGQQLFVACVIVVVPKHMSDPRSGTESCDRRFSGHVIRICPERT